MEPDQEPHWDLDLKPAPYQEPDQKLDLDSIQEGGIWSGFNQDLSGLSWVGFGQDLVGIWLGFGEEGLGLSWDLLGFGQESVR